MGQKLMHDCKLELVGTKEHGKMLKRLQNLEDGKVPAKETKKWKFEGQKRRFTRTDFRILLHEFEMKKDSWHKKVCAISQENKSAGQRNIA